jgi:CubicO group peptidase (beta-lactamase class C family)
MRKKSKICLALLCVIVFALSESRTFAQTKPRRIDTLMTMYQKYGQFNGAVLVAENGRVVYQKGFGFANLEWNNPNTIDTKFRIASITKSFTAVIVFRLIEQGKLRLDGKVSDYLPDYPKAKGDKISINHLLTHTAGLRGDVTDFPGNSNNFPDYVAKINAGFTSTDELVKRISEPDLAFEPGTKFSYSNNGYILLGAIIEKVAGKSYEKVLDEEILTPLGMKNAGLAYKTPILTKRADGYDHNFYGYQNGADILVAANGGMYSTVGDLFLFDEALYTNKLLSQKSKDVMFSVTPYVVAYGWKVKKPANGKSRNIIETDGSLPGFNSLMVRLIDGKQTIVLLTNVREMTYRLSDISRALTNILNGKPYDSPKRSLAEALFRTVREKGIEAALRQYRTLSQEKTYYLSEFEFNTIGYNLMGEKKIKEAIEIFKINTEANPQSANAFDSLGEAYMENDDKELAIRAYQKSVELDPQNTNGIEMLKKLRGQ